MFRMENQSELAGNNVASLWRMKHTPYLLDIQSHQDLSLQGPGSSYSTGPLGLEKAGSGRTCVLTPYRALEAPPPNGKVLGGGALGG